MINYVIERNRLYWKGHDLRTAHMVIDRNHLGQLRIAKDRYGPHGIMTVEQYMNKGLPVEFLTPIEIAEHRMKNEA